MARKVVFKAEAKFFAKPNSGFYWGKNEARFGGEYYLGVSSDDVQSVVIPDGEEIRAAAALEALAKKLRERAEKRKMRKGK